MAEAAARSRLEPAASHRIARREQDPGRFLPYARHVDRHIIALDNRSLMITFQLDGIAFETRDADDLNQWHEKLNGAWRNLADERLAVWTHHVRRIDQHYPQGQFRSDFARSLDAAYRRRVTARHLYINELYVTLVMRPAAGGADKVADLLRRLSRAGVEDSETDADAVQRIEEKARDFEKLAGQCRPRRLGLYDYQGLTFSEPLEMLEQVMTGRRLRIPLVAGHLGSGLYSSRAIFGAEVVEVRSADRSAYGGLYGIREYPATTRPGQLGGLLSLQFPLIVSQSFTFLGKAAAAERFRRKQNQMYSTEDVAESQADALSDAADDLASNRFVLGDHHFSLAIYGDLVRRLNEHMSHARAALADAGMVAAREGPALEAAYWSQLPGNFAWRARPAAITSRNFAAFAPFHSYPAGRPSGNHWGEAVALLKTSAGSPYYFNFHNGDLGHTLIVGPSGAGKTVIQNFLMAQLEKSDVRQIFIDKDRGAEIFVRASGGHYLALANGQPTGFAPLKGLADTPANRQFLRQFVQLLVGGESVALQAADERLIAEAITAILRLPPASRSLRALRELLGQRDAAGIGADFEKWCAGGSLGWAFDNTADTLRFDARFVGFDMTDFLDNPEIRSPVMLYLFHRIDGFLAGEEEGGAGARTAIDVDEFWKALGDEAFRAFAQDGLKTFRKRNAILIFGTQSPADALRSDIAHSIVEQVATQILLPNPRGRAEDYIGGLGLTNAEFRLIREELQPESRRFLVKQGHDSIVVELDLDGLNDELAVLSGRSETLPVMEAARRDHGPDPADWLPVFQQRRPGRAPRACGDVAIAATSTASTASAQGMPVFDTSTYAQTLATVRNTLRMIDQGREQIGEAQRLYESMNKLTDVNSLGSILNMSGVRNLLPPEARDIERLISGNAGTGALGDRALRILGDARLGTDLQGGSEADRAYQTALEASGQREASTAAVAEAAFDVTTQRTAGLEDLRLSLDSASDAKEVADLQARIAVETAHIQNDQMQLQAIAMRKAAQDRLDVRSDDARMIRDLRASVRKAE